MLNCSSQYHGTLPKGCDDEEKTEKQSTDEAETELLFKNAFMWLQTLL